MALARKPFVVIDAEILSSSIWSESAHTKLVWLTLLILCDTEGNVGASLPGIANAAGVTVDQAEAALVLFQQPDKHSRTQANEGRRLEVIERGWRILNFREHLDRLSNDRKKSRDRVWRHRQRKKAARNACNADVTPVTPTVVAGSRDQGPETSDQGESTDNGGSVSLSVQSERAVDLRESPEKLDELGKYAEEVFARIDRANGRTERDISHHSPGEFDKVSYWHKHGIPLRVALTAIESMGERAKSASYCHPEVVKEWQRVRRMTA